MGHALSIRQDIKGILGFAQSFLTSSFAWSWMDWAVMVPTDWKSCERDQCLFPIESKVASGAHWKKKKKIWIGGKFVPPSSNQIRIATHQIYTNCEWVLPRVYAEEMSNKEMTEMTLDCCCQVHHFRFWSLEATTPTNSLFGQPETQIFAPSTSLIQGTHSLPKEIPV